MSAVRPIRVLLFLIVVGAILSPGEFASAQKKKPDTKVPAANETLLKDVKPADGFVATIFAAPPDVSYPTCICAAPNGHVYVGVDLNGSLGTKKGQGRVVRCIDTDNDGVADEFVTFCEVQHPRGLFFENNKLLVLHPPFLSAFYDDDGDGKSDRQEVLVKGISTDATFQRGADHTTNGFRLGIDGWLYIAVGDFGFVKAEGKDGKTLQLYGGGVVRVRPDGTDLEIVSRGQRNIYDVAVSPTLDLFTRDNTNDGGGWDVRLSHVVPYGHYGYPSLFKNFTDEAIAPLNDFGGGSPCGALYLQEPGFPEGYGDTLYTVEWGPSTIFRHPLKQKGAGYEKSSQTPLVKIPAPTDIDVDGSGRIYVASWRGGGFNFSNPNVGFIARLTPKDWKYQAFPDLAKASFDELVESLTSSSSVRRLSAQREILHRRSKIPGFLPPEWRTKLVAAMNDASKSVNGRVAAMFTWKQLESSLTIAELKNLAKDDAMREHAIRAIGDRKVEGENASTAWLESHLKDPNPRVRLQTLIALAHLNRADAAKAMIPLTSDADPIVSHVAVRTLTELKAVDACLQSLDSNMHVAGCLRVLQGLHDPKVVAALLTRVRQTPTSEVMQLLHPPLCRLYFKEHDWDGKWWGTRPDTTGPYFKRVPWEATKEIGEELQKAMKTADSATLRPLLVEMKKHRIDLPGVDVALLKVANDDPGFRATAVDLLLQGTTIPPEAVDLISKTAVSTDNVALRGRALRGLHRAIDQKGFFDAAVAGFTSLSPKDLSNKDLASAFEDFTRDVKHAGQLDRFVKLADSKSPAERDLGWAVVVNLATGKLTPAAPRQAAQKKIDQAWASSDPVPILNAVARTKTDQYAFQIRGLLKSDNAEVQKAAQSAYKTLGLDKADTSGPRVELKGKAYDAILAEAIKTPGDPKLGSVIFLKQGCIACHTVSPTERPKGPYLGDIAVRSKRPELLESILKPSAKVTQGFETIFFALSNGKTVEGFVTKESGDEVELRNTSGVAIVLAKDDIEQRTRRPQSAMPEALADNLTIQELASLVAYLESLNTKK